MIQLEHASGTSVTVDPHGATVVSFHTHRGEVLFVSPNAIREPGRGIRGGIPICWPWFGLHPEHPDWPSQGLARTRPWSLASAGPEGDEQVVRLELVDDHETHALWPHAFHLQLTIRLGQTLSIELEHTNTDARAVQVAGALHTYLAVPGLEDAQIDGLSGARGYDKLLDAPFEHGGPIRFTGPVDRIFEGVEGPFTLTHGGGGVLVHTDAPDLVIWNPGTEAAAAMDDLGEGLHERFVCIEAASTSFSTLGPGETFRLATRLSDLP